MREKTENDIIGYIEYLRDAGFVVSLSCLNKKCIERSVPLLMRYELHLCDICFFLKNHPATKGKCYRNKDALIASDSREIIYNCCWAGVEEYIFPVIYLDQLVCRVHISGYSGTLKSAKRRSELLEKKPGKEFTTVYSLLSEKVPTQEFLVRLIAPFQYMFEKLVQYNLSEDYPTNSATSLYPQMLNYIYTHYLENIKVEDMAQALNYSPSYLAAVFKKMHGGSIMEHVNVVRLVHGLDLLRLTRLPIWKIAYECGFRDANYFSLAFRKFAKMTPKEYREQNSVLKQD